MPDAGDQPMLILQIGQTSVAALALTALAQAAGSGTHEQSGTIGTAHYHLRWLRPTLIFPPDAPDAVRLGLSIEGGVVLESGRVLSVDAFLTATASPALPVSDGMLHAELPLTGLADGSLHLTYAGQELPPAPVRPAQGLPPDDELDALYDGLRTALRDFLGGLPSLPLTPRLATTLAAATRIAPEGSGAAFALCFPEEAADAPLPIALTPSEDAALLVNSAALGASFAAEAASRLEALLPAPLVATALEASCAQDRLWFAVQARQGDAEGVAFSASIETIPYLADDVVRLTVEAIAVGSVVGHEEGVERFAAALAAPDFIQQVEDLTAQALRRAVTPAFGAPAPDAFAWQWATEGATALRFAATTLTLNEGWLALGAPLALRPPAEDLPELLAVELHVAAAPEPLDEGRVLRVTVVAAPLTPVALPADHAWWNANAPHTLLLEHSPTLPVELRVAEDDPHDTLPRHLRARPLPIGLTTVHVALIDAFGRVALTEYEIDLRDIRTATLPTLALPPAAPLPGATANTLVLPPRPGAPLAEAPTRITTAYSPAVARDEQVRSSIMGALAGGLAVITLVVVIVAVLLTRTVTVRGQEAQPTPTATLAPAPTSTPVPPTATFSPKSPTPPPELFGIFAPTPAMLEFSCAGGHPAPQTLSLANTGTGSVDWSVRVYGGVRQGTSVQLWATVAPTKGTLAPNQSTTLTVTAADAFCSVPNGSAYLLQFTATRGSAALLNVYASHS